MGATSCNRPLTMLYPTTAPSIYPPSSSPNKYTNGTTNQSSITSTTSTALSTSATPTTTLTGTSSMPTSNVQTSYRSTTSIPVSNPSSSPVNNSSNSRAIVGGVISGIAAIIIALLIFYLRCYKRRDEFGGNFKPDRIISYPSGSRTFPQVDLDEENEFTPYPDHASGNSMCQYGESPFLSAGVAAGAGESIRTTSQSSLNIATTAGEGYPSQSFVRPGQGQYPQGKPNMYPSSNSRAMKERKAASGRQGLGLADHPDGGQMHSAEGGETRDVPPVYDSIWP